jgi:hypothetical protein
MIPIAKTLDRVNAFASVTIVATMAVAPTTSTHATSEPRYVGSGKCSRVRATLCPRSRDCGNTMSTMNRISTGMAARKCPR